MQKELAFDRHYDEKITGETIKGILLEINPIKDDGAGGDLVCDIADLNKIAIDLNVRRSIGNGQFREVSLFSGYLEDLILALYAQNTKLELIKKVTSKGYLLFLDWTPAALRLRGEDELQVRLNVPKTAFTGTIVSRSFMQLKTISAVDGAETAYMPQVKTYPIGSGQVNIDENLGNGIVKIVAATDYTADYLTSTKAKLVSGDLYAQGLERPFTESELLVENIHFFDNNPESDVQDLCVYYNYDQPLNRVKLRAKLDQGADNDAKILTVGIVSAR